MPLQCAVLDPAMLYLIQALHTRVRSNLGFPNQPTPPCQSTSCEAVTTPLWQTNCTTHCCVTAVLFHSPGPVWCASAFQFLTCTKDPANNSKQQQQQLPVLVSTIHLCFFFLWLVFWFI
eukprot:m.7058 g.7058  ORF g.7058 m.7058 type:complete len:119 (+) comp5214_c0_seq2:206-562(+)